jgi:Skp family chaperone for outer membrane proteins
MTRRSWVFLLAGALQSALAISIPGSAPAQAEVQPTAPVAEQRLRVRSLDQERLFQESQLGQRILSGLEAARQQLEAENQRLFDQLAQEEQALTDQRASLTPEEFRQRADAFDARVETIRAERSEASQALARRSEAEAQRFFDAVLPVIVQMMSDESIDAVLRPEAVILSSGSFDMTDETIARLDAATGFAPAEAPDAPAGDGAAQNGEAPAPASGTAP